jgi:hypothetical protein
LDYPTTQTTTTNVYGNTFGSGGFNTFSGMANTTTYGTQTTYIPYNVDRFDYVATYWAKMKPGIVGVQMVNLSDEQNINLEAIRVWPS